MAARSPTAAGSAASLRAPASFEVQGASSWQSRSRVVSSGQEEFAAYLSEATIAIAPSEVPNKLSATGLTLNMMLSIIGTTVLGIAAQMQKGGWLLSPALLCVGCAIVGEMTWLVSRTIDKLQSERGIEVATYQDFAEGAFGFWGRILSSVTSTLALVGMICNGLVLISDNLQFNLPITWDLPGCEKTCKLPQCQADCSLPECCKECGRRWWALLMTPFTFFYAFVDPGNLLKKAAVLGPVVCVGCIVLAWAGAAGAVAELGGFPESCRHDEGQPYWSLLPSVGSDGGAVDGVLKVAAIASYGFYCFAVVVTVPALKGQMAEPPKLVRASVVAYATCTVLFLVIMLLGYWGFGNLGPSSIIDGMRAERPEKWFARTRPWETGQGTLLGKAFAWMIISNLLLTDAIYVPCTVSAVEGWAPGFFSRAGPRAAARIGLSLFRTCVATVVSEFLALTGLTSSLFCICNNILIPVLAFHRVGAAPVSGPRKLLHAAIFCLGLFVVVCGTWSALRDMAKAKGGEEEVGLLPRKGLSAECRRLLDGAAGAEAATLRAEWG